MLMRTDPFRQLDRIAEQMLGTPARPAVMPLDAYRKADEVLVQFDLPGVDPETIDLTVEKDVLSVHATRTAPPTDGVEVVVAERPQGTFSRQLFLGEALDTERVEAEYRDGVLTVRIPLAEQAKPRRVKVGTGSGASEQIGA